MSKQKIPVESYLRDAKALARKFPSLKKYRRRKTLKPAEKAAIARARNIFEIVQLPNKDRPEHLREYTFPADRKRSTRSYLNAAKRMERIAPDSMKKYRGRKQLKPGEKAYIRKLEKRTRFTAELEPISEPLKKSLDKVAKRVSGAKKARVSFPIPGVRAIKLKNIENADTPNVRKRTIRATDYGMSVTVDYETGYRRFYKFVYTGTDFEAMREAAEDLFREGARTVYFWINHGRSSAGYRDIESFEAAIGDDEAREGMSGQAIAQIDTDISVKLLQAQNARSEFEQGKITKEDLALIENQMVWIYGVIGFFQIKK